MKPFIFLVVVITVLVIMATAPHTIFGEEDPLCVVTQIGTVEDRPLAVFYCEDTYAMMRPVSLAFYNYAMEKGGPFWTRRSAIR